jgi:hypothetical protein
VSNIEKAGLTYPNRGARALLLGLEDLLGKHGLEALLKQVGLEEWTDKSPPDNLDREIDFTQLTALNQGLLEFYGQRSGSGLARQANRSKFEEAWGDFSELARLRQEDFSALPLEERMKIGGETLGRVFNEISDLGLRITTVGNSVAFEFENCPYCLQVTSELPLCGASAGWIEGFLRLIKAGRQVTVLESSCSAAGAPHCIFTLKHVEGE